MKKTKASSSKARDMFNDMSTGTPQLVEGSVADIFAALQDTSGFTNSKPSVDTVLLNVLRLLNKKDSLTRAKSLQELLGKIPSSAVAEMQDLFPHFVQHYTRGVLLDPDWKCRSLYNKCLEAFFVSFGRGIEQYLGDVVPSLLVSGFDESSPSGRKAFECMFPEAEKRTRVVSHYVERVLGYVSANFDSTPELLSEQFRCGGQEESFEMAERWDRVEVCSLRCLAWMGKEFGWDKLMPTNPLRFLLIPSKSPPVSAAAVDLALALVEEAPSHLSVSISQQLVSQITCLLTDSGTGPERGWDLLRRLHAISPLVDFSGKLICFLEKCDLRFVPISFLTALPEIAPQKPSFSHSLPPVFLSKVKEYVSEAVGRFFNPDRAQAVFRAYLSLQGGPDLASLVGLFPGTPHEWELRSALVAVGVLGGVSSPALGIATHFLLSNEGIENLKKIDSWDELEFLLVHSGGHEEVCSALTSNVLLSQPPPHTEAVVTVLVAMVTSLGEAFLGEVWRWKNFKLFFDILPRLPPRSCCLLPIADPADFVADLALDVDLRAVFLTSLTTSKIVTEEFTQLVLESVSLGAFRDAFLATLVETNSCSEEIVRFAWRLFCQGDQLDVHCLLSLVREPKLLEFARTEVLRILNHPKNPIPLDILESLFDSKQSRLSVVNQVLGSGVCSLAILRLVREVDGFWDLLLVADLENNFLQSLKPVSLPDACELLRAIMRGKFSNFESVVLLLETLFVDREKSEEDSVLESVLYGCNVDCSLFQVWLLRFVVTHFQGVDEVVKTVWEKSQASTQLSIRNAQLALGILVNRSAVELPSTLELPLTTAGWAGRFNEENFACIVATSPPSDQVRMCEKFLGSFSALDSSSVAQLLLLTGDVPLVEAAFARHTTSGRPVSKICSSITAFLAERGSVAWAVGCLSVEDGVELGLSRIARIESFVDFVIDPQLGGKLMVSESSSDRELQVTLRVWRVLLWKFLAEVKAFNFCFLPEFLDDTLGDGLSAVHGEAVKKNLIQLIRVCFGQAGLAGSSSHLAYEVLELGLRCLSPGEIHARLGSGLDEKLCAKISPKLIDLEVSFNRFKHENLRQQFSLSAKLLVCTYSSHGGEISAELKVQFPSAWPLRLGLVEVFPVVGLSKAKNTRLQISIQNVFKLNGIQNAVQIWIENIEGFLANVQECYICYSVTYHHGTKGTGTGTGAGGSIPNKECKTCKNKFHSECLLKWFKSSSKSNCPLCTNPF